MLFPGKCSLFFVHYCIVNAFEVKYMDIAYEASMTTDAEKQFSEKPVFVYIHIQKKILVCCQYALRSYYVCYSSVSSVKIYSNAVILNSSI